MSMKFKQKVTLESDLFKMLEPRGADAVAVKGKDFATLLAKLNKVKEQISAHLKKELVISNNQPFYLRC